MTLSKALIRELSLRIEAEEKGQPRRLQAPSSDSECPYFFRSNRTGGALALAVAMKLMLEHLQGSILRACINTFIRMQRRGCRGTAKNKAGVVDRVIKENIP